MTSVMGQIEDDIAAIHRYVSRITFFLTAFGGFIIGVIIGRAT